MTKLRIMSDVHVEFQTGKSKFELEPAGEDILVLAGDIGVGTEGLRWADEQSKRLDVPVVMIAGNHEFYRGGVMDSVYDALHEVAKTTEGRVTFLQNEGAIIEGVRFLGATLWTDWGLFSNPDLAMYNARQGMNDYNQIMYRIADPFTPERSLQEHLESRAWLATMLAIKMKSSPTVVMTHHAPSAKSIAGRYARDHYSPAYASHLDQMVIDSGAVLWVHGHVHHSFDYKLGDTPVRTNPRGYYRYEENPKFDPSLVIEI